MRQYASDHGERTAAAASERQVLVDDVDAPSVLRMIAVSLNVHREMDTQRSFGG